MNGLPPHIHWDGPQNVGSRTLMQFTDTVTGDTFTLPPSESKYEDIFAKAAQCRAYRNQQALMAASFGPPSV